MAETYGGTPRDDLKDTDFVDAERRSFPIATAQDVRDAVASWGRYKGPLTFAQFKQRLTAIARRKGLADALPDAWAVKAIDDLQAALDDLVLLADDLPTDDAIKAGRRNSAADQALINAIYQAACAICELAEELGAEGEDDDEGEDADTEDDMAPDDMAAGDLMVKRLPPAALDAPDSAIKLLPDGRVVGLAVRFGTPDEPDLSAYRDYFTKATDFWLKAWATRPMLYHHAQDEATKDAPVVGQWTAARVDDVGVWLEGQLDSAHRYAGAIKEMIKRGVLKLSSDSAPHLVVRERQPNGTHEIKRWPLLAASLTPTPAEPRLLPVTHFKSLYAAAGLPVPLEIDTAGPETDHDDRESADGRKAAASDRERLLFELDLLTLEAA